MSEHRLTGDVPTDEGYKTSHPNEYAARVKANGGSPPQIAYYKGVTDKPVMVDDTRTADQNENPANHPADGSTGGPMGGASGSMIDAIREQTKANRPNINTPWASQQWTQGKDGQWTMNAGLNGGLSGMANGLQTQASHAYAMPFDNGSQVRQQAIDANYNQAVSRLDPRFQQEGEQLTSQLANQGLDANSEAYKNAMGNFGRTKNDAYTSAMSDAIKNGTMAQEATFGQNMQAREMPMQELQGLQGFMGMPGFNQANGYAGAVQGQQQYGLQQQQMQNQILADAFGAFGKLGNSAGQAYSDERLKEEVERLPAEAIPGVPLATFKYKGSPHRKHLGVIAQDVEKVAPGAVHADPSGFKLVDYSKLGFNPVSAPTSPAQPHQPGQAGDPFGGASPEEVKQLMALGVVPDQEAMLQHQLQQAAALKQPGHGYSTPIGAGIGAMADIFNGIHGHNQEAALHQKQQELLAQQTAGRSLYADILRRKLQEPSQDAGYTAPFSLGGQ